MEAELVDNGVAADVLAGWVDVLEDGASDLVDQETIAAEAEQITNSL